MSFALHFLPLRSASLPAVADWLLARRSGSDPDALASMLLILPSRRACAQLAHALLEAEGRPALILPRIHTEESLVCHLESLEGGGDRIDLPDPSLRPLLLAPALAGLEWLRERPESAPGLAAELIALFDELRRSRQDGLVLQGRDDSLLLRHAEAGAGELMLADLSRIRQAWRLYREVLPHDHVDRQCQVLERARRRWPGKAPALVAAAHLGSPDRVLGDLLGGLADQGVPVHWLTAGADDPRSRLFLATYRDDQAPAHPLRGIRELVERLGAVAPPALPAPPFAAPDLPSRLAELADARRQLGPGGPISMQSCRDPEHESKVVAEAVCDTLAAARAAGEPPPAILVATPDRGLAARIAAQLGDAGLQADDSRGRPLINLPAGRLLRDILRTVVAGWPFGPLMEILTHPDVRLTASDARPGHAVRVQLLEAAARRCRTTRRGLATLRALAGHDDRAHAAEGRSWSMLDFVNDIASCFHPLARLDEGPVSWQDAVAAIESVWAALVPQRPLNQSSDPRHDLDDLGATADLLGALDEASPWLPPAPLAEIAARVTELLAGPVCEVRPLRAPYLPVRLTGLIEARLESADLLVLAGLGQDTFPGPIARPLFLPERLRQEIGLTTWRQQAGRDAELFLRLLHVSPRLLITWPRERDGQPTLPSPLVQRLALAAPGEPQTAGEPLLRRARLPDVDEMASREVMHRAEPEPIPAPLIRPPAKLSHTNLQVYRDCPYRFLLAGSLRLRRVDPLAGEFSAADAGTMAHRVMHRWIDPAGPGWTALAAGDGALAQACLREAASAVAREVGAELPGAAVSMQTLLALAPALVRFELDRAAAWRPAALEAPFTVTVAQAAAWLREFDPDAGVPFIPPDIGAVPLAGSIDRIDVDRDGAPHAAVIDYKTGRLPSRTRVRGGRELQLHLYALAVETGSVAGLRAPAEGTWRIDHGAFYGLNRRDPALPKQPHLTDRTELAACVRTILAEVMAIFDPATPYALVPRWQDDDAAGELPCRHCEFLGVCRLEERGTNQVLAARLAALLTGNPRRTA